MSIYIIVVTFINENDILSLLSGKDFQKCTNLLVTIFHRLQGKSLSFTLNKKNFVCDMESFHSFTAA